MKLPTGVLFVATSLSIGTLSYGQTSPANAMESAHQGAPITTSNLWSHDNLYVWDVVDSLHRGPEERAQLLERMGFKHYAYFAGSEVETRTIRHELKDIHGDPEAQITALQRHGIDVVAWYFWDDADDPQVRATFELFKKHNIHPQIWVPNKRDWVFSMGGGGETMVALHTPVGYDLPKTPEEWDHLSAAQMTEWWKLWEKLEDEEMPKTEAEQQHRVAQEAIRIRAFAKLAARYGCTVALYNELGRWYGNEENELAIVKYLNRQGVTNVGLVYNFSHPTNGRDYDDTKHFPQLWRKIQPHVVAVNITAVGGDGLDLSQGESELEMMRTIQESGWKGPIGVEVHHRGDAAVILQNDLIGLDWLSAELKQSGSGGMRPKLPDSQKYGN